MRVAVFADGKSAEEAIAAGADVVGAEDLVAKVKDSMRPLIHFHWIFFLWPVLVSEHLPVA